MATYTQSMSECRCSRRHADGQLPSLHLRATVRYSSSEAKPTVTHALALGNRRHARRRHLQRLETQLKLCHCICHVVKAIRYSSEDAESTVTQAPALGNRRQAPAGIESAMITLTLHVVEIVGFSSSDAKPTVIQALSLGNRRRVRQRHLPCTIMTVSAQ